jgi:hypothetical protein
VYVYAGRICCTEIIVFFIKKNTGLVSNQWIETSNVVVIGNSLAVRKIRMRTRGLLLYGRRGTMYDELRCTSDDANYSCRPLEPRVDDGLEESAELVDERRGD